MKKKAVIITIIIISLLFICFGIFFYYRNRKKKTCEELAEKFCRAFVDKNIYGFDEICEDDTVFEAQNSIYSYIRDEFKSNLENGDFQATVYDLSEYDREMNWLILAIYFINNSTGEEIKLSGFLGFQNRKGKYYINTVLLLDDQSLGYTYEIIAKHNEHIDLSYFRH